MFTGLIKNLGEVRRRDEDELIIEIPDDFECEIGDSVSVNGACLTVTFIDGPNLSFDLLKETLSRTNLGSLRVGEKVNIEFSLKLNDLIGGHLVTGHVDFVSELISVSDEAYAFSLDSSYAKYFAEKGSVSLNGVSLTLGKIDSDSFVVHLIPSTLEATNLKDLNVGDSVNVEVDLIARYVVVNM